MDKSKKNKKSFNLFKLGYKFVIGLFIIAAVFITTIVIFAIVLSNNSKDNKKVIQIKPGMNDVVEAFRITDNNEILDVNSIAGYNYLHEGGSITYDVTIKNTSNEVIDYVAIPKIINYTGADIPLVINIIAPGEEYIVGSPKEYIPFDEFADASFNETLLCDEETMYSFKLKLLSSYDIDDYKDVDIAFVFEIKAEENEEISSYEGFFESFRFVVLIFIIWFILLIIGLGLFLLHAFIQLNKKLFEKEEVVILPDLEPMPQIEPTVQVEPEPVPVVKVPKQPLSKRRAKLAEKPKQKKVKVDVEEKNFDKNKKKVKLKADIANIENSESDAENVE